MLWRKSRRKSITPEAGLIFERRPSHENDAGRSERNFRGLEPLPLYSQQRGRRSGHIGLRPVRDYFRPPPRQPGAAYEDTGLEPEDFKRAFHEDAVLKLAGQALGIAPDRLRELAQADKENRVLPEGSGWFVTCSGKKLTVVMDIEAALRRKQDD